MAEPKDKGEEYHYPPEKWFHDFGRDHDLLAGRVKTYGLDYLNTLKQELGMGGKGGAAGAIFGEVPAVADSIMPKLQQSLNTLSTEIAGVQTQLATLSQNIPTAGKVFHGNEKNTAGELAKAEAELAKPVEGYPGATTA